MKAVKAKCAYCQHFYATEYNRKHKPEYGNCAKMDGRRIHASMRCASFKLDPAVNGTVIIRKDAA